MLNARNIHSSVVGIVSFSLVACGNGSDRQDNTNSQESSDARNEIGGYGGIKFASSFQDTIATLDAKLFNPAGLNECIKDLPLKGCFLPGDKDAAPFQIKDGIPYRLTLAFNKRDKLTDIDLNYDREGDISRDQCLEMHERTLDWLVGEYGQIRSGSSDNSAVEAKTTSGGNTYYVGLNDEQFFVTQPMRTVPKNGQAATNSKPITKWDNARYASILTHFIVVDGEPTCRVTVSFSEPESVERRKD